MKTKNFFLNIWSKYSKKTWMPLILDAGQDMKRSMLFYYSWINGGYPVPPWTLLSRFKLHWKTWQKVFYLNCLILRQPRIAVQKVSANGPDLAALQKDAKDPAKAAALEAQTKAIDAEADKVEKQESDVVDQVNVYCTGSK